MLARLFLFTTVCLAWTIEKGKVAVGGSGDQGEAVSFDEASEVWLPSSKTLDIRWSFTGGDHPLQAEVSLESPKGSKQYPAKIRKSTARVTIPASSIPSELLDTDLKVLVLVASYEGTPAVKEAFTLSVSGKAPTKSKFAEQNDIDMAPQPEIYYQFRPAPRTVSAPVALVFVGGVSVLFAGLLVGWLHAGVKLPCELPKTALPFLGAVVATEAVFLGYFIKLSVFTTLFYLALLTPVLLFTGQKALRA